MTEAAANINQNCLPPYTTQTSPRLATVGETLQQQEQVELTLATKPESVAAAPDQNAKRAAVVAQVTPLIEAATDKKIAATEAVATGAADIDSQPPSAVIPPGQTAKPPQKGTCETDMENFTFRYVIVPETYGIEASWGPWNTMTGRRDQFKTDMRRREQGGQTRRPIRRRPRPQPRIPDPLAPGTCRLF